MRSNSAPLQNEKLRESRFSPDRIRKFHYNKSKGLKSRITTPQKSVLKVKQASTPSVLNPSVSTTATINNSANRNGPFSTSTRLASTSSITSTSTANRSATTGTSADTRRRNNIKSNVRPSFSHSTPTRTTTTITDRNRLSYVEGQNARENNENGNHPLNSPVRLPLGETQIQSSQTTLPRISSPRTKKHESKDDTIESDQATNRNTTSTNVRQHELMQSSAPATSPPHHHQFNTNINSNNYDSSNKLSQSLPGTWTNQPRIWTDQTAMTHYANSREEKTNHKETELYLRRSFGSDSEIDISQRQRYNSYMSQHPHVYMNHNRNKTNQSPNSFNRKNHPHSKNSNNSSSIQQQQHPDVTYFFGRTSSSHTYNGETGGTRLLDDDDRTFDYGVRDEYSQASGVAETYTRYYWEQQHHRQLQQQRQNQSNYPQSNDVNSTGENSFLHDEQVERFRKSIESPMVKTAAGVVGAATLGCIVMGPVGLLLGAAAVGIGVGVMQIPEEQRSHMSDKATKALAGAQESAFAAIDDLSSNCATRYQDLGIADHIPYNVAKCCVKPEDQDKASGVVTGVVGGRVSGVRAAGIRRHGEYCNDYFNLQSQEGKDEHGGLLGIGTSENLSDILYNGNGDPLVGQGQRAVVIASNDGTIARGRGMNKPLSSSPKGLRSKKVACLRAVPTIPVNQIHCLNPTQQSRAWLDVLASADTTYEEKNEAMEEILILAKDKERARIFLALGILDSIMWVLNLYFTKVKYKNEKAQYHGGENDQELKWANPEVSVEEYSASKLAAACCVTLGKAHCAAIHTEGDLFLMSLYERGTVPEERQLAQMLYEVPHHARVTPKNGDPTIVNPELEVFSLKRLTLPQAEDLAKSIKSLADGYSGGGGFSTVATIQPYNSMGLVNYGFGGYGCTMINDSRGGYHPSTTAERMFVEQTGRVP